MLKIIIGCSIVILIISGGVLFYILKNRIPKSPVLKENYRDPIYPNVKKMVCDWYGEGHTSPYSDKAHVLSSFPLYTKAY